MSHCRALSKKDPGARRAPAQYRTMAIPSPHSAGELAGLINSAEEFLWSVDSEFRLLSFNQALSKHIENHSGILLQQGMLPEEFFPAEAERWRSLYRRAIREGNYDIEQIAFGDTCYSIRLRRIELDGQASGVAASATDITQRRETEKLLRESEERYRSSFEQAAVGMAHISFAGNFLRCNQRFASIVGYPIAEIVGREFREITLEDDLAESNANFDSLRSGQAEMICYEKCYVRKDGTLAWVSITSSIQRDSEGNPLHLVVTIQDIHDRKLAEERLLQAQEALRKNEERFRATFEQAPIGFLHTSLDGRILRSNEFFARIVGYSVEELQGTAFQKITSEDDRGISAVILARFLSGSIENASFEKRYIRKDGSTVWAALTISIQRDAAGKPVHFITTVQDIHARKEAEEKLVVALEARRLSEERYHAAFQTTLDAMAINRLSDDCYIEVNRAFLEMSGYSLEDVIGHTPTELGVWVHPEDMRKMAEEVRNNIFCRNLEAQFRRKNGDILWGLLSSSAITLDGVPCVLTVTRDVSDARMAADEIRTLAFYDPLTGLPNRRLLLERLHQALSATTRSGRRRALFFVDLDDFKMLNDTLGHQIGDLLLKEVARRLSSCTREVDTVARLGGDEFVVMLEGLSEDSDVAASQAQQVGEKILKTFAEPFMLNGRECRSTCSIGVTIFGDYREETSEVLQQADIAMYHAKASGRNNMHFFAPALQEAVSARAALEEDLRQAIEKEQFLLYYQPQISRGRVVGAEALLRWQHPERGLLGPDKFIYQAEASGMILPLGIWVLQAACRQIALWSKSRPRNPIPVAVNISARQFRQQDFVEQVLSALEVAGADPRYLKLELTESMLVENIEEVISRMSALKEHGLRFSLDDFGTGYSSLAYLQRLPLDQLKIDRSFIGGIGKDGADSAIAQAVISMGRALHMQVIAEGVETVEQYELLARMGCHIYQGYYFGRPVPAETLDTGKNFLTPPRLHEALSAGVSVL